MRVLVLGATGSIGRAVVSELIAYGHDVLALARSGEAAQTVTAAGAGVLRGDLRQPEDWGTATAEVEGIIQVAATWGPDMGDVDGRVLTALISGARGKVRFVYTGGCWLYGDTGGALVDEGSPRGQFEAFRWMDDGAARLLGAACFSTVILHPANVYSRSGGVFSRFREAGEVWGDGTARWPLVHCADLARAYRLALEGDVTGHYNVCGEAGVLVSDIAARFGAMTLKPVSEVIAEFGTWARGATFDQRMDAQKITRELGWVPEWVDYRRIFAV